MFTSLSKTAVYAAIPTGSTVLTSFNKRKSDVDVKDKNRSQSHTTMRCKELQINLGGILQK